MAVRSFRRPAIVLERATLCLHKDGDVAVSRQVLQVLGGWRHLGYLCVAVDYQADAGNGPARARAEMALQRRLDAALRSAGGLDGTFVYPRPGESVDPDVPRASVFARLVMEATVHHRIDLPRSVFLAHTIAAVEGARLAGIPCGLIAGEGDARHRELAARPSVRPDFVWPDLAAVRAAIAHQRERDAGV